MKRSSQTRSAAKAPAQTPAKTRSRGAKAPAKNTARSRAKAPATSKSLLADLQGQVAAIHKAQAVIEFSLDGRILVANDNFLNAVGYSLEEIQGQHHSMFVDPVERLTPEYRQFWEKLGRGEYDAGQYKRFGKGGREIWIQASYNPIFDAKGKPYKVVKYATDVTADKLRNADFHGQLAAISKAQAVIEFSLDGKILSANENFLNAVGYRLEEIKGQHHSMFVDPAERLSPEYRLFWEKLGRGEYDAGQYRRVARGGKEIWIQASYNPILDMNGKAFKVVKYATDITQQVVAARTMERVVEETQAVVDAARAGDLVGRLSLEGKDGALAGLCAGLNSILDVMSEIIGNIKSSSVTITGAAHEIVKGNAELSLRTEQQASSLEETAASMEELTATVKQNADNAKQANQLAVGASGVAGKGGEVVSQVVETMGAINESSKKIVDIIGVIDGIAFQTNILALNAAVEAARAGEQGRGFAVVASEVRNLAQRSAAAAKEIKGLISNSVEKVESGSRLVDEAGKTMQEIVTAIGGVTGIMSEIAAASREQSLGIEQVNQAIVQMDKVTQQNAALVQEASAAAESMEKQVDALSEAVSTFRLPDEGQPAVGSAERRSPARATNVQRLPAARALSESPAQKAVGGDWHQF